MKMIINLVALMIGSWFVTPPADVPVHIDLKEENSETSFAKYLSMFPLKDELINIGFADIEEFNNELNSINKIFGKKPLEYNTLNKYLPHEAVRMFSRRSSNREVFPLARVYIDNERLAVVYVSVAGQGPVFYKNTKFSYKNSPTKGKLKNWINKSYRGLSFRMQVYDLDGNMISSSKEKIENDNSINRVMNSAIEIAGRSIDNTHVGFMDHFGNVTKTTYQNQWEKDIYTYGIEGNSISSYVKLGSEKKSLLASEENINGSIAKSFSTP